MKKIFIILSLLILVGLAGGVVLAREVKEPVPLTLEVVLPQLPNPGLKPGDFFYFLDEWGEAIGEFFTFNLEAKAILQTKRALERVAEVNALLEEKGVDAPGLDVAEAKIQRNIARANEILETEQAKGRDVALLAEQLDDKFTDNRKSLNQVFEQRRQAEKTSIKKHRNQIRRALEAKELAKIPELRSVIDGARIQKEKLDNRKREIQDRVSSKEEQIKRKMRPLVIEARRLERVKEELAEEGERAIEILFEEREIAIEHKEEALEVQLNVAILAKDIVLIEEIHSELAEVESQAEVLEIEETQLEEKIEAEITEIETVIEIILKTRDDQDGLKMIANKARMRAKEDIEKALAKTNEQNIHQNPIIIGLIKQAERFLERGLMLFEKGEYKKSYLSSEKAMDFAGKAFKLISVKENLRRERTDLPVVPVVPDIQILPVEPITPTPVDIIESQEVFPERVKRQIKTAEQLIEKTRQVMNHKDVEGIAFPVVIKLIERAENNIDKAEALLKQGVFNSAYRHAKEAVSMARRAYSEIQGKLQTGEIKIIPDPTERIESITPPAPPRTDNREDREMRCRTDLDCKHLICPQVIGRDTPRCHPERNVCFCGPGRNIQERPETQGMLERIGLRHY